MIGKYLLRCTKCSNELERNSKAPVCPKCHGALETIYDYEIVRESFSKKNLETRTSTVWKYIELLPVVDQSRVVTLGEGGTRLVHARSVGQELGMQNLFLKDESRNPTCSFKDRKSTVAITKACEFGFEIVCAATAGNAGSSMAAYAAKAGLHAIIFTYRNVTRPKLSKLLAYGADVLIVDGASQEVLQLTSQACEKYGWYNVAAASRYNPYVKDGAKTEAIEVCEQMKWRPPDWLIIPLGGGCGTASCWKGVKELYRIGLIDKLPKLIAVQGSESAPVVKAFKEKTSPGKIERIPNAHTIAHSIEDDWAPDGDQALIAIRESGGLAVAVTDDQILMAQRLIGKKEGMYVEPASSSPVAAVRALLDEGTIDRTDTVVCIATGFGLNEPDAILSNIREPPTIGPTIRDLEVELNKRKKSILS